MILSMIPGHCLQGSLSPFSDAELVGDPHIRIEADDNGGMNFNDAMTDCLTRQRRFSDGQWHSDGLGSCTYMQASMRILIEER
jgi:hypothetical protein